MKGRKLVRVQEKGQVTLPADLRRKLGLKKGDLVAVEEADEGILIIPQEVLTMRELDRLGEALKKRGLSLGNLIDLIESGGDEAEQASSKRKKRGMRP
ncbi:MAG: AbrB/MazE/SpoVT family DNA-binding domain-containing protein [Chloroflexi bacterium]|nr:AbrB/MazE/SpoVT family DNA-binding domain-containing protein [Chloroflexota bacterium]